jgi:hypothetical protein
MNKQEIVNKLFQLIAANQTEITDLAHTMNEEDNVKENMIIQIYQSTDLAIHPRLYRHLILPKLI